MEANEFGWPISKKDSETVFINIRRFKLILKSPQIIKDHVVIIILRAEKVRSIFIQDFFLTKKCLSKTLSKRNKKPFNLLKYA